MTNSDNLYGTFNKRTQILSQIDDGSSVPISFSTVDEAKTFFFTDQAIAVFEECCTELQWAVVDSTKLKYTMTFGTKGGQINPADDWAGQFNSRKQALRDSNNWGANPYTFTQVEEHLF